MKDIVLKEFLVQNLYTFFHKNQLYIQPKIVILIPYYNIPHKINSTKYIDFIRTYLQN